MEVREAIGGQNRAVSHSFSPRYRTNTDRDQDRKQVSNLNYQQTRHLIFTSSLPQGEFPPPPPKIFFGRDELVQRIISSAENFTSMTLVGTGGIGKTSITLTALNDSQIKQRFGDNRTFIRCDRLTASHTHFLRRLSEATGAGVKNPEDLSTMRRYLPSKEMVIVLDNAESILGLAETNSQEIYTIVDELSQFPNIWLIITSRISNTLPPHFDIIEIPTLSVGAGRETFYQIYRFDEQSG